MGRLFVVNLEGKIYSCKHCRTHLALVEDIVSKSFHCRHGKAYLFYKVHGKYGLIAKQAYIAVALGPLKPQTPVYNIAVGCIHGLSSDVLFLDSVNVSVGEKEDRMMMTGLHTVADIFCVGCGSIVGWKYETAYEKSQKYKEGKSVLERYKVSGPDGSNYWVSHETHIGGSDADDA